MSLLARFEQKYIPEPNSGCWLWIGAVRSYGKTSLRPTIEDGGTRNAARVSWKLHRGAIPEGLHVLHKCDVTLCVNPDHLFLGTHLDNMADMMVKRANGKRRQYRFKAYDF